MHPGCKPLPDALRTERTARSCQKRPERFPPAHWLIGRKPIRPPLQDRSGSHVRSPHLAARTEARMDRSLADPPYSSQIYPEQTLRGRIAVQLEPQIRGASEPFWRSGGRRKNVLKEWGCADAFQFFARIEKPTVDRS